MLLFGDRITTNLCSHLTQHIELTQNGYKKDVLANTIFEILIISFSNIKYCKLIGD